MAYTPLNKPTWDAIGNAYDADLYEATAGGWKYIPTGEIVVAIPNMLVKAAALTPEEPEET